MANEEQVKILKQGGDVWNRWTQRDGNLGLKPDLVGADLRGAVIVEADLSQANLSGADLSGADLGYTHFHSSNLFRANLQGANLRSVDFLFANFWQTNVQNAHFGNAIFGATNLGDTDLSQVKGLDSVVHRLPSEIGITTLYKSGGNIPEAFLRGCGVPDTLITFARSLLGTGIDFYSCFISYSSRDQAFAERLYADLQSRGVRCWFAPEDLKIGDKFRQRIDESIRVYDKLLLILSVHSINSPWVEDEVESALEREHRENRPVLFPVRIDDAVMRTDRAWAASLRRTRHIGDFTRWRDHDAYQTAFARLVRDLKAESKLET